MTTTLDAPATPATEEAGEPTTAAPLASPSEAFLIACILADLWRPLCSLRGLPDDLIERRVESQLRRLTHAEILRWQINTAPAEWALRWREACKLTARVYGERLPRGVAALPDFYQADFGLRYPEPAA